MFYFVKDSRGFLYPHDDLENLCLQAEACLGIEYEDHSCKLFDREIYDEEITKKDGKIDLENAPEGKACVLMIGEKNEEDLKKYITKIRKHKESFDQKECTLRFFYPDEVFENKRVIF